MNDSTEVKPVQDIKRGEYVKRTADAKKVYKRGEYRGVRFGYELIDVEDMNRCVHVKKGTQLHIGFTY